MAEEGIAFPLAGSSGARSSTPAAKTIWSRALQAVGATEQSDAVLRERDWRHNYPQHVLALHSLAIQSRERSMAVARGGLNAVHQTFRFVRNGEELSLQDALTKFGPNQTRFHKFVVKGTGAKKEIEMPFEGHLLRGKNLVAMVKEWADYGCLEGDVVGCVDEVMSNPQFTNTEGVAFVLIGAGSEVGPLQTLLNIGATIVPIATKNQAKWTRTLEATRKSAATLILPTSEQLSESASVDQIPTKCGCSLLTDTPELIDWLKHTVIDSKQFHTVVVANNVYIDGEAHVRASIAMDLISSKMVEFGKQNGVRVCLSYLGSPATPVTISEECQNAKIANARKLPMWQKVFRSNILPPVVCEDGTQRFINNGLLVVQGPNYALAKTMQMWRAVVAREDEGVTVSTSMAPATRSLSVVHNKTVAVALEGQGYFEPNFSFDPSTASAVMSVLLLHAVLNINNNSKACPTKTDTHNPFDVFGWTAVHGGSWRCPCDGTSLAWAAFALGSVRYPKFVWGTLATLQQ